MADRNVLFLLLPGLQLLDLAGPADVFAAANEHMALSQDPRRYRLRFAGPVRSVGTATGLEVRASPLSDVGGAVDTVVIPGGIDFATDRFDPEALAWLRRRAPRVRRIASVCTGAFVLARAGLLEGRRATTHWTALDALREAAPTATIDGDPLYIRDDSIYTSAGVTAGIDLALTLVEEDHGHRLALEVARTLVMFLHRPGGQSQFSAALHGPMAGHPAIRAVQTSIEAAPEDDHCVAALARRAGMSERHFVRLFTQHAGESPARYVQRIRVERARQLLEGGALSVEEVGAACGFGSAETLRRVFLEATSVTPSAYRARFAMRKLDRGPARLSTHK